MTAVDVALAVRDALNRRHSIASRSLDNHISKYITTVLVPKGGMIPVDANRLKKLGIPCVFEVASMPDSHGHALFEPSALVEALRSVVLTASAATS